MGPIDLGRKRGRSDGDILVGCLTSEIAPSAKDIDENSRFPEEALVALNASGFNAIHLPLAYGGQGADSVATCIVIEEVARVCGSSSLIPRGEQARYDGPDPRGLRGAEAQGAARHRERATGVVRTIRA